VARIWIWQGQEGDPFSFSTGAAITDHDPTFSLDAFIPFAEAVFMRVNQARASGALDQVRHVLGDGLWQEFQAEGRRPERAGLTATGSEATRTGQDGSWDTVVIRFTARTAGRRGRPLLEDWIFQRPVAKPAPEREAAAGALTPGAEAAECPVCGAPLSLTDEGTCRYCGVSARGGLGGWRLVRTAAAQRAPAAQPIQLRSGPRMSTRFGVALTLVILAAALLPGIFFLVTSGQVARLVHGDPGGVPAASTSKLSSQASFTGAVSGDTEGKITMLGGAVGPCSSRTRHATGLIFSETENSDGGKKSLGVRVNLPAGREGPGTYDLKEVPLQLDANYSFSPDQASRQAGRGLEGQVWKIQPGTTRAVLVIRPDASGSLTASGLMPKARLPAGNSLAEPLNFTVSFSCR
jgi:hypothetical protein